ncbi:MAG: DUF742 domain-containing protein [Actinomycetota bacterium]
MSAVHTPPTDRHADAAAEFDDDEEIVRSFMLTGGRTRAAVTEVAIETIVTRKPDALNGRRMSPDHHRIVQLLSSDNMSVAEISAHLGIPLRAAVILVSEMLADGVLESGSTVEDVDHDFLSKIRNALQLL